MIAWSGRVYDTRGLSRDETKYIKSKKKRTIMRDNSKTQAGGRARRGEAEG